MHDTPIKNVVVGILSRSRGDDTEYLLVASTIDFGEFTGYWYPPGGHVNQGEIETEALIREMYEELGLTVQPIEKIAITSGDIQHRTIHWWTCETSSNTMEIDPKEIAEAGWFTQDEMAMLALFPATKNFFEKYIFIK